MQFMVLIYNDPELLGAMPQAEFDETMRGCLAHADALRREGRLLESHMLGEAREAKAVRVRDGRTAIFDGPFAEAKEVLGGFNLIEAKDIDEALAIASEFPWARTGRVEVRAVQDFADVRQRVGAPAAGG